MNPVSCLSRVCCPVLPQLCFCGVFFWCNDDACPLHLSFSINDFLLPNDGYFCRRVIPSEMYVARRLLPFLFLKTGDLLFLWGAFFYSMIFLFRFHILSLVIRLDCFTYAHPFSFHGIFWTPFHFFFFFVFIVMVCFSPSVFYNLLSSFGVFLDFGSTLAFLTFFFSCLHSSPWPCKCFRWMSCASFSPWWPGVFLPPHGFSGSEIFFFR